MLAFELRPFSIFILLWATVNTFYQKKKTDIFNKFAFAKRKLILIV